jgi:hypothetical protein
MSKDERNAALIASAAVGIPAGKVRQWFLELEEHPERYQFATHGGFAFTRGRFGEVGSRFQTWERFHTLRLGLHFEVVAVGPDSFAFRLLQPRLPVEGAFRIEQLDEGRARLSLTIEGETRLGQVLLACPLVKGAIEKQIRGEVEHIKASMEELYGRGALG